MTERVLLAGCGDIGLRVARQLRAGGRAVSGLRRSARALPDGIATLVADLTEPASLNVLPADIAKVVYLPTPDARTPAAYRAVFIDGLRHLLRALDTTRLRRLLFVSSSAVYGDHEGAWVDEDTPPAPPGFNGEVLLEAEHWLQAQGLPVTVLRLAGLYGPGRVQLLQRLREGRVQVPREAPFWANRIHVDDAAAAIVHLLDLPGAAPLYLGVDDTPLPLAELYDHLASLLGVAPPPAGPAPTGIGSKRLSNKRLRASGFAPHWPDARQGYAACIAAEKTVSRLR